MCPSSTLWGGVLDCDSQFPILSSPSFDGPEIWRVTLWQGCVPLSVSSHVHIVPNVLSRSLCSWPCTSLHLLEEGHNHPIVRFAYLWHMIDEEFVFFSFLYIKLFKLGVARKRSNGAGCALNHWSAVPHHKMIYMNSHSDTATLSAPMMLLCCSFASASLTSRNLSSLSVDRF